MPIKLLLPAVIKEIKIHTNIKSVLISPICFNKYNRIGAIIMIKSNMLSLVENHVLEMFAKKSVSENLYHNLLHTTEVVEVSHKIAQEENLSDEDLEILLIASWFHDTGYFRCCVGHEDKSAEYANIFLTKENYPSKKIEKVVNCIKATRIPQNPKNKLEEIICDADLQHLGMTDLEERGKILRKEIEIKGIKKLDDIDWLKSSIEFLTTHKFFTNYAIRIFNDQKRINQKQMEKKLKELKSINHK
jgi:HD superfamily phosphodiesterase